MYFPDLILIYSTVMSQQLSSEVAGLRVNDSIVIRFLFSQFVYVKMAALKKIISVIFNSVNGRLH